jgi:hypothetical protein
MTQLQLFSVLQTQRLRLQEPIARQAMVADGCRYWLKRAWGGGPMVCWAMCNPSNADATKDDPTMLRVMEFSASWGFGSCVVINPIPFISSTPAAALQWVKRARQGCSIDDRTPEFEQWRSNISTGAVMIRAAEKHVAAWGNNLPDDLVRAWLQEVAEASADRFDDPEDLKPIEWHCIGTTKSGAPKHPLARGKHRVPAGTRPARWSQ